MYATNSDQMLQCPPGPLEMDRRWKSNNEVAPSCPRCASSNTKFCYYNNYSLSQPRYFCKGCRRYWTKGGSLRNVPVGGGCRKNRRSKSAKSSLQSDQRLAMSYVPNPPSPGGSTGEPLSVSPRSGDGSDIDLAAVFAKFLNQNSGLENKLGGEDHSFNGANSSSEVLPSSTDLEIHLEDVIESQNPVDPVLEVQLLEELPQVFVGETQHEDNVQEFMGAHDMNGLELQTILSDEIVPQEVLWSGGTTLSNIGWQPMMQLQEFGPFSSEDQFKVYNNVMSDNCASLDLPGYEIFSRPYNLI